MPVKPLRVFLWGLSLLTAGLRDGRRDTCHILAYEKGDNTKWTTNAGEVYNVASSIHHASRQAMSAEAVTTPAPAAVDAPITDKIQLLQEMNRMKEHMEKMEVELTERKKKDEEIAAAVAKRDDEFRAQKVKELDSMMDLFLELTGTPKTAETEAAMEPLRTCKDTKLLNSMNALVSGMVSANKAANEQVKSLKEQYEQVVTKQLAERLFTNNKYADPAARFKDPIPAVAPASPIVKPISPQVFYNPTTYNPTTNTVSTPIATPQEAAPAGSQAPVIYNWSRPSTNTPVLVQASSSHAAPSVPSVPAQREAFSLDKMAIYDQKPMNISVTDAYNTINSALRKDRGEKRYAPY